MSTLLYLLRNRSEKILEPVVSICILQEHARIVHKVSLSDDDLLALRAVHHDREENKLVCRPLSYRKVVVCVLE